MTAQDEAARLLEMAGGDLFKAMQLLEGQLNVLHTRAQVLLSLASVVITVTGFSGRAIAVSGLFAAVCLSAALFLVLGGAVWTWLRVMRVSWTTQELDQAPVAALECIILRRERKTAAYRQGGLLLCTGVFFYCLALARMLLAA